MFKFVFSIGLEGLLYGKFSLVMFVGKCVNRGLEFHLMEMKAIGSFGEMYKERVKKGMRITNPPTFKLNMPISYFDGASQDHGEKCGVGDVLKIANTIVYKLKMGCGRGTNTRGELLAIWCLIYFANLNFYHIFKLLEIFKLSLIG